MCELNDLKRTPATACKELNISSHDLEKVINGLSTEDEAFKVINKMGDIYPIDNTHMILLKDDTINGIRFMSYEQSKKTGRVYKRVNKNGILEPYYEYRDTAMSRLCLFKPEWISQLRVVNDNKPDNPDMVLNKGHNMHQYGLFVGPVNFYYEDINGEVHCSEMNTGDSNYITPFLKHSFTNRSSSELANIIACTSGCDTSRAQRELYVLGEDTLNNYVLDYRQDNKATLQLIEQHMKNNMMTFENLNLFIKESGGDINIEDVFKTNSQLNIEDIQLIADVLNVEISDIMMPKYKPEEECVIKYLKENKPHPFPNEKNILYDIHTLARTSKNATTERFNHRYNIRKARFKKPDSKVTAHLYV